jgi:hypothetical protein
MTVRFSWTTCSFGLWRSAALLPGGRQWDRVKLQSMANQPIAKLARNLMLEALNFRIAEVDDLASLQIDQVVVMFAWDALVPQSAVPEGVTFNDSLARKKLQNPIDGRAGDARIPFGDASMQLINVRMIFGSRYNLSN